jgi:uncharacterized protein
MLIPTGGFGGVIGDRDIATQGSSECLFNLAAETNAGVDEVVEHACAAGAESVTARPDNSLGATPALSLTPTGHVWLVTSQPFPT